MSQSPSIFAPSSASPEPMESQAQGLPKPIPLESQAQGLPKPNLPDTEQPVIDLSSPPKAPKRLSGPVLDAAEVSESPYLPRGKLTSKNLAARFSSGSDTDSVSMDESDTLPPNYCNPDLGDFMSGRSPEAPSPRTQLRMDLKEGRAMLHNVQDRAQEDLDAARVASLIQVGHMLPQEQARVLYPAQKKYHERAVLVKALYKRCLARDADRAVYLEIRWIARYRCAGCQCFKGTGHEQGCAMDDKDAITQYTRSAMGYLDMCADSEYVRWMRAVLYRKYTRTHEDLVEQAKERAAFDKYDSSQGRDLELEPMRKVIELLTDIERHRLLARSPATSVEEWIQYAHRRTRKTSDIALGGFGSGLGFCGRREEDQAAPDLPWLERVECWYQDALATLGISEANHKNLLEKVKGRHHA